ncbi:MAG TPA: ferritin-like domain-containing protein [Thermoleophilaceae bacterium]|nr:ferritin-like domain-containing protein [Thermoleophilaceae bacterium]
MSDLMKLDVVDTDGAIREAEEAVAGDSRADFFRKAALGGAATIGGATLLGGFPALAMGKPSTKQDIEILNYALTLEYLENEFYKAAIKSGVIKTPGVLATAKLVQADEAAHVAALPATIKKLGGKAVKKPKFDFSKAIGTEKAFLDTAVVLEDTGVAAYAGQGPRLKTKAVVVAALGIHSVEARHASALRVLAGKKPVISPVDKPKSMKTVLAAVKKTGFIKS